MSTTIRYVGSEPKLAGYGIITGATELLPGTTFNVRDDAVEAYTCQPSLFEVVVDAAAPAPVAAPVVIAEPAAEASGELSEVEKEIADLEARKAALETQEAK